MADHRDDTAGDELVDLFREPSGRVWLLLEESNGRARVVTPAGRVDWRNPERLGAAESASLVTCGATDAQVTVYLEWVEARERETTEREMAAAGIAFEGWYTPDEAFKSRVLELLGALSGREAMVQASSEYGVTLAPSYYTYPHTHIHRWRGQRRSA